ncbi:hypothetical protein D043_0592A, partial [Vibrio parahaemolyticus EKP-021]
MPVCK